MCVLGLSPNLRNNADICPFYEQEQSRENPGIRFAILIWFGVIIFFLCNSDNTSTDNAITNYSYRYLWSCTRLSLNCIKLIEGDRIIHIFLYIQFPDPCKTEGCNAPYNIGCRAVNNKAQCICPTCPNILKPVCTSDHVQDLSECHMKKQACELKIDVAVEKRGPCGTFWYLLVHLFCQLR